MTTAPLIYSLTAPPFKALYKRLIAMFPLLLASHMICVQNNYTNIDVPAGVGAFPLNNIHNTTDLLSSHQFLSTWGALCFEIKQQQKKCLLH